MTGRSGVNFGIRYLESESFRIVRIYIAANENRAERSKSVSNGKLFRSVIRKEHL